MSGPAGNVGYLGGLGALLLYKAADTLRFPTLLEFFEVQALTSYSVIERR
jgi:hypothetical protein